MSDFFLRKNFIFFKRRYDFQFYKPIRSVDAALRDLKTKPAEHWEREGEEMVLRLLKFTHRTVPAYRKLLREERINPDSIKTFQDFRKLPVLDKDYYLKRFKSSELFPNKDLTRATTFSATSGSTGEPFYFPRGEEQDWLYQHIAEIFLKNQWEIDNKRTLAVIGFGLGIWIGGIFTYKNFNRIAVKGYNLALVPVGASIDTYSRVIARFGHLYDQIILMGYPPFIKDMVDEAKDYGVDWKKYNLRVLTAAEGYSEKYRDYLTKKLHLKNPLVDTINMYGTVELGTMAHETPITNLIRRIVLDKPKAFEALFPDANRLPTLAQFHPQLIHLDEANGEVVASGFGSLIPLIRYRFPDKGGVIQFDDMVARLKSVGIDLPRETEKAHIAQYAMGLPFVYVYDRSDNAASLVGITIYPEYFKDAIHDDELLQKNLTGKFTLRTDADKNQNQFMEINLELRKGIDPASVEQKDFSIHAEKQFLQALLVHSSECRKLYETDRERYGKTLTPRVILWPYHYEQYFKPGAKQRWVKK